MFLAKTRMALAIVATLAMSCAAAESKSYSNARFGFAFDYPATWSLVEQQKSPSGEAMLSLKLLSPDENIPVRRDYSPGSVSIEVFANPARRPLPEWLDEHGWPFGAAGRSVTPTSIGGLPAPNRFTYVASKDWVLRLSALAPDANTVVRSIRFNP